VRRQELRGLVADLRPTIPALARLNRSTIPLLNENRALSACQNNVLLPFAKAPIPDPDFPDNTNQPFYKQGPRGFVGLAGESRLSDGNSPVLHVQINAGPNTVLQTNDAGDAVFGTAGVAPKAVRPARPASRPPFRPDIPCETQDPPNMNAVGGRPDKSVVANDPTGLLPPLPLPFNQKMAAAGKRQMTELFDYLARKRAGKPAVRPMNLPHAEYVKRMKELGLGVTKLGKSYELPGKAATK
jgi:hypothetical protein